MEGLLHMFQELIDGVCLVRKHPSRTSVEKGFTWAGPSCAGLTFTQVCLRSLSPGQTSRWAFLLFLFPQYIWGCFNHVFTISEFKIKWGEGFNLAISVQGLMRSEPLPTVQDKRRGPPWTGHLSTAEPLTHAHSHSDGDKLDKPACTSFWGVGGSCSPWRKPAQRWGNVQTPHRQWPHQEMIFFSHQYLRQHWTKYCYSRTDWMHLLFHLKKVVSAFSLAYLKCQHHYWCALGP